MAAAERIAEMTSAALSFLVGVAGWHYLFYSRAAQRLAEHEGEPLNRRRVRLRRTNGGTMILLAVALFLGTHGVRVGDRPRLFGLVWLAVVVLLLVVLLLMLLDVTMTARLRRRLRRQDPRRKE